MTRQTQPELAGFLTDLNTEWLAEQTVLLTALYHVGRYDPALFDVAAIRVPPRIAKSVLKRQAEFLAGRLLAQYGQQVLQRAPQDIPIAPSRAPVWPQGLTGSLTHAKGRCAAILSTDLSQGIGIDCEAIATGASLDALHKQTLTATDRSLTQNASDATCVFSAKEALYKALHAHVGHFFGFDAAELAGPIAPNTLRLSLTQALSDTFPADHAITVQHRMWDTHVLTWLCVPTA